MSPQTIDGRCDAGEDGVVLRAEKGAKVVKAHILGRLRQQQHVTGVPEPPGLRGLVIESPCGVILVLPLTRHEWERGDDQQHRHDGMQCQQNHCQPRTP